MPFLAGLGLGLSLIVAIGAQNVFVLRQGLRKEHVGWVVAICAISDALLIVLGVSGMGAAVVGLPWLATGARWAGAAFLLGYAILAARRAWQKVPETFDVADAQPGGHTRGSSAASTTLRTAVLTCLALTWLNPHVYLDTVFLLGTVAASYGDTKWVFAAGAVVGSLVWFVSLGYGARLLNRWLNRPQAWRVLDGVIAVIMAALAIMLAASA
ncbi:LysE/ArgO family amino acid transporter [Demequina aurantiaca]|uniref:LysE/ArgO family amino acid transporter n=1 Tax=Demequina aurantiaca TaxID=676200 RepID=UPI003D33A7DA